MLLAIDVGNTNTVLGMFDGDELRSSWRIKTDARTTADEMVLTFRGLLAGEWAITGIALCSTVPAVLREMRVMLDRYFGDVPTVIVEPGMTFCMTMWLPRRLTSVNPFAVRMRQTSCPESARSLPTSNF